jgi:hypothetical protein
MDEIGKPIIVETTAKEKKKWSTWIFVLAIFGIVIHLLASWVLLKPGNTLYFWFVMIATRIIFFTIPIFCVAVIVVPLWLLNRIQIRHSCLLDGMIVFGFIGIGFSLLFYLWCWLWVISIFEVKPLKVNQQQYFYLLKSSSPPLGVDHYYCESNNAGFSGECIKFAHFYHEYDDTDMFIDPQTGLITIENKEVNMKWVSTNPPSLNLTKIDSAGE